MKPAMIPSMSVILLVLMTFTTIIPEATGNCIRRYGHSCIGGHGKRTEFPASRMNDGVPHLRLASDKLIKTRTGDRSISYPFAEDFWQQMIRSRQQ